MKWVDTRAHARQAVFSGQADQNGAWTEEEDQFAQMMKLFRHLPSDHSSRGKYTRQYFTDEGIYI